MGSQPIENIRRQFHGEWLFIAVDDVDEATTTPVTGHLIAHSPSRDEIHRFSLGYKGLAMLVHSDDWPKDLVTAFTGYPCPRQTYWPCQFSLYTHDSGHRRIVHHGFTPASF